MTLGWYGADFHELLLYTLCIIKDYTRDNKRRRIPYTSRYCDSAARASSHLCVERMAERRVSGARERQDRVGSAREWAAGCGWHVWRPLRCVSGSASLANGLRVKRAEGSGVPCRGTSFCALRPHKYHHREAFVLSSAGWNQEAGGHLHSATLVDAVVCLTRVLLPTIADLDGFAHTDRTPSPSHTQCVERMAERRARFRSRRTRIIAPARAAVASIDCAASISRSWSSASSIKSVCTLGGAGALGATCATGGMAGGYCR
jgi:hypothetical protein